MKLYLLQTLRAEEAEVLRFDLTSSCGTVEISRDFRARSSLSRQSGRQDRRDGNQSTVVVSRALLSRMAGRKHGRVGGDF
ncbi:hypothetical protein CHARACLAT_005863 [Characodon lateralis]|uniref:Uncharacterized protein n=1 Tax=Characodon lateralis TaxID=208331 RepID=A0ABU7E7D9_9TELE|nr:hypothetical protein [Characodon lateralis]